MERDDEGAGGGFYAIDSRPWWRRVLSRLFPEASFPAYPDPPEPGFVPAALQTEVIVVLNAWDRLRILISGAFSIKATTCTDVIVGRARTTSSFSVLPPRLTPKLSRPGFWSKAAPAAILILAALAGCGCSVLSKIPINLPTPPVPASPSPTPTGKPTPAPTPVATPAPATCAIPDGIEGKDLSKSTLPAADVVVAAVNAAAGRVAGCPVDPVSRCPVVGMTREQFNASVVAQIKAAGGCAGIQASADELCVLVAPGICQGVEIYDSGRDATHGTVRWAPGSVKDTWTAIGPAPAIPAPPITPTPAPQPTPGPSPTATPAAKPPRLARINTTTRKPPPRLIIDATPQTDDRAWMDANGFQGRNFAPLGPECDPTKEDCSKSVRAINETADGPYTWRVTGDDFFLNNDNPLQIVIRSHPAGSTAQVCGGNGVCSDPVALP